MTQDELVEIGAEALFQKFRVEDTGPPRVSWADHARHAYEHDLYKEATRAVIDALTARGLAVVPVDETMPMHASFDVDGGLGLEWENRKTHILVEVRGQAEVVWIIREGGKLIHGDEITVKAEPLPAALPKEGQA